MIETHHARLYFVDDTRETPFDATALSVESEIRELQSEKFSIDDVRALIAIAYTRPLQKSIQTIVVRANDIGLEAQHALLKILEEPPSTTRFILILKRGSVLLPTLRSRVSVTESLRDTDHPNEAYTATFLQFLRSPIAGRLEFVANLTKTKDIATLESLEGGLSQFIMGTTTLPIETKKRIMWCQSHLRMHGASKKMLWEEIAFMVPVEKTSLE